MGLSPVCPSSHHPTPCGAWGLGNHVPGAGRADPGGFPAETDEKCYAGMFLLPNPMQKEWGAAETAPKRKIANPWQLPILGLILSSRRPF